MMSAVRRSLVTLGAGYGICTLLLACTGNVPQDFSSKAPSEVGKTATAAISSAGGGTLKSAGGTASVSIPPGALVGNANLTVTVKDKATAPTPEVLLSNVYDLGPSGTQFQQPVILAFQAASAAPAGQKPVLAFLTAQQTWQVVPNSNFDPNTMTVTGQVDHFTDFAVIFVAVDGTGCVSSPDPNAYCSPLVCDTVNNKCQTPAPVVTSFLVGGALNGLNGGSVVLANNGGDLLSLSQNGNFAFATAQDNGAAYLVTVAQQPTSQSCSVDAASGNIRGADINSVQVTCRPAYDVGGTVAGLGTGTLTLQNGNTQISVTAANQNFVIANLPSGTPYAVTVQSQPIGQDCELTNGSGSGTVGDAVVDTISVQCNNLSYPLGGHVTGLVADANVTLQNGTDTVSVANGVYTFPTPISFGDAYSVTITSPAAQNCAFAANVVGQGAMTAAAITSVDVVCTPAAFSLGGSVTGLLDNTNVVLSNGMDSLSVANGDYTLPTAVAYGSDYNITLTSPDGQVCVAASPNTLAGTMPPAALQRVDIVCALGSYPVGGTILGLVANTNVTLSNGADTIYVGAGPYAFPTPVTYTRPYAVSIIMSPAFQSCAFTNAGTSAGTMPADGVSNVDITCTPQAFTLGGGVTGLTGSITLTNGNDAITTGDGVFTFPTQVPYGADYAIDVTSPFGQTCVFAPAGSGNGTMPAANVRNLSVVCAATQYPLGGTITGLVSNTNVTLTNGQDSVSVSNGDYSFPTRLVAGANFAVSLTAPTAQACTFSPSGTNAGSMVMGGFTGVDITCVPGSFMVGGTVSGLVANTSLGITDGIDTINANNGQYTLPTPVVYGSTLTVAVNPPVGQSCVFDDGNATLTMVMGHSDLTQVNLTCAPVTYPVGGFVVGLVNDADVSLQNGSDTILVSNGTYAFPTNIAYNSPYSVTLASPAGQTCAFTGSHSGTMGAAAISNIGVSCVANAYTLGGSVTGLLANTTVTVRQGGDVLTLGNGNYALPTQVAFGGTYDLTVTQPVGQTCVFGDGNTFSAAVMGAADISGANIACSASLYTVGGNVSGLVTSNQVTLLNGNDSMLAGNGRYTFASKVAYNASYNVTALSPNGQICTFTGTHNGVMGASNVTNADLFCTGIPFALGGHVAGLVNGTTVTLRNAGDSIGVGNGNFIFPTQVVYNTSYSASLVSPAGQTCVFSPVSISIGTMPANAVSNINVTCGPQTYTLGGSVSGLAINTNVTLQNGSDIIDVGNGAFTFDVGLPYSSPFAVSLTAPDGQTCSFVGAHTGTMGAANITNLSLACTPITYALGGTVSGLVGTGTVGLQNGSDSLSLGNGSYTFATPVAYGATYAATLVAPAGQSCAFSPANSNVGVMPAAAVGSIDVVCGPQAYTLGGVVSGLSPNAQVGLQNGADSLFVGNGSYTFATALAFNSGYNATLVAPAGQACAFSGTGRTGTMGANNITNLNVLCSALSFTLGGSVSGLVGSSQVTLQQGGDSVSVGNGSYTFATAAIFGSTYTASLVSPAGQSCAFSPPGSSTGSVPANDVTSINVVCGAQTYSLGGSISGLVVNTNVTLVNGNDSLAVSNGLYTFATALPYGTAYAVSLTSPSGQTCSFVGTHSGTMGAANITNIGVNCSALNYNLGGSVSGLVGSGTVTLQNGGDSISVSNGNYTFPTQLTYASQYTASVTSPSGQTCVFTPLNINVGAMPASDVSNVDVSCGPQTYTLGGSVTGLVANSNVALQNGTDSLLVGNGSYTFPTGLSYNTGYAVTLTSPVGQTCSFLGSHTGTMGAANVSNIGVYCSAQTFALGGTVSGLVGSGTVSLQNGGDSIAASNGPYTFPSQVGFNSNYSATLFSPAGQTCNFSPPSIASGAMPANDVNDIDVVCGPQTYTLGGSISGLVPNTQVTLQNGNDSITAANGAFTFSTGLAFNTGYNATIVSPAGQSCVFNSGHTGIMGAANVATLRVGCSTSSFVLGGTVSGLMGNSVVDLQNGADSMAMANGAYTFATPVPYASNFSASVTSPAGQDCEFSPQGSNMGTMPGNDVTSLDVVCVPHAYNVGGSVSGLLANTQVGLQNINDTMVAGNGNFIFPTQVAFGAAYAATLTSPVGQTCVFNGAANGTLGAAAVTNLVVSCTANNYALGGSISGLVGNTQVALQNGSDSISVANGNYTFPTPVAYGAAYAAQLTSPGGQTCSFSPTNANAGTMPAGAVVSVNVVCGSQTYNLGGNVVGLLANTQVTLQSGTDSIGVGNGGYTFPTALLYGASYSVSVVAPTGQSCTFDAASSGTMGAGDITDVNLTCVPMTYAVGGSVSGLVGNGQVNLQNGNDLVLAGNGNYIFATQVAYQSTYAATLASPAGQMCNFSPSDGNTGVMPAAAVTSVNVTCTAQGFTLGGSVSGLLANTNVTLLNGAASIDVSNGGYSFPTALAYNSNFAATLSSPDGQTCAFVNNAYGTMGTANITNLDVACTPQSYALGGSVSGLVGGAQVSLQNGSDQVSVGNGTYTFPTQVVYQGTYAVTLTSPTGQSCDFDSGNSNAGIMPSMAVSSVNVTCGVLGYTLGGTVSGLLANTNVTLLNGADSIDVSNGGYSFPTSLAYNSNFAATLSSPDGQTCAFVNNAYGTMGTANITNLDVACTPQSYALGGSVSGLVGGAQVGLQNGSDQVSVGNGTYTFPTQVVYQGTYAVTLTSPTGQSCDFDSGNSNAGIMPSMAVSSVNVTCGVLGYTLGGTVSGLLANTNVTLLNGADSIDVSNGGYSFPTALAYNSNFAATLSSPDGQTCAFVNNAYGTMGTANITNLDVACTPQSYALGGSVSGLVGGAQVSLQNGSDQVSVGNGTYTFPTQVVYQGTYAVTLTSPTGQSCDFDSSNSNAGIMPSMAVSSVNVTCGVLGYTLGGSVSGLLANTNVTLLNGADSIDVSNGGYSFPTALAYNSNFAATLSSPDGQTCAFVNNAYGTMGTANITNLDVACTVQAYALGGSVSGLADGTTLTLQSGGDTITVPNGSYVFPTPVAYDSAYAITLTVPDGQTCAFEPVGVDGGTMPASDMSNANVSCVTITYTVGGTVSGLAQGGNVVLGTGTDTLDVSDNGAFTFPTPVADSSDYNVFIVAQPTAALCSVSAGQGSIAAGNVTGVLVNCANSYTLSVTVTGLAAGGSVGVTNGADAITISGSSTGAFPTPLFAGDPFGVAVVSQPATQLCTVSQGTGMMPANDASVAINCAAVLNFTTNQAAISVIGQPDFTSSAAGLDNATLSNPLGAVFAAPNGDVYLSDTENLRLVGYHQGLPAVSGTAFDFEVGQPDFVTSQSWATPDANNYYPHTITGTADALVVTDGFDSRVLILHTFPESTIDADVVLGQPDFTSNGSDCQQTSLNGPRGAIATGNDQLLVADTENNRVLIWNSMPTNNGQAADLVLGQPDFTTCNQPGANASAANSLNEPWDVWSDGTHVLVADTYANRVLVWNTFPTSVGQNADAVIGQPDFTTNVAGPMAQALATPSGVTSDGNSIFIAEYDNMRVGQWTGLPWQNGTPALGAVLGQPDANTASCNQGGAPSAQTLCQLGGISIVGTQLVVADTVNNRFVVFQSQ